MWFLAIVLAYCSSAVYGVIPPSNVCYQHTIIQNACTYGNLTVAVLGKTFKPKDCGMHIDIKDIERAPFLYINSTNSVSLILVYLILLLLTLPGLLTDLSIRVYFPTVSTMGISVEVFNFSLCMTDNCPFIRNVYDMYNI